MEFETWYDGFKKPYETYDIDIEAICKEAFNAGKKAIQVEAKVKPANGVTKDLAVLLLTEVMKCEMKHDENGHAYIKIPCRSLFDLGAQISEFLEAESRLSV